MINCRACLDRYLERMAAVKDAVKEGLLRGVVDRVGVREQMAAANREFIAMCDHG